MNALATLGEYPLIRYYNPPSSYHPPLGPALSTGEHLGKRLAFRVQEEIDAYARNNSAFPVSIDIHFFVSLLIRFGSPFPTHLGLGECSSSLIDRWISALRCCMNLRTKRCATIYSKCSTDRNTCQSPSPLVSDCADSLGR